MLRYISIMKNILTHIAIGVLLFTTTLGTSTAQQAWKNARHSVVAGMGGNIFMGDLGGGNGEGGHIFSFKDIDSDVLKFSMMLGYKYRLTDRIVGKCSFTYSMVGANDANAGREVRRERNLNFKSNLLEFGVGAEYYFLREKKVPIYSGENTFWKRWSGYISIEIAMLHFNPMGEYQGQWYELQPLCTEGQGTGVEYKVWTSSGTQVVTANEKYKLTALSIPVGLGFMYRASREVSVGFELLQHFTTTDYIDDCSSYYFDYDQQGITPPSEMTKIFADRRVNPTNKGTGVQRGSTAYNDTYFTMLFTVHYRFLK